VGGLSTSAVPKAAKLKIKDHTSRVDSPAARDAVFRLVAAVTAACSILESLFKVYIEDNKAIGMPGDQSLKPLWKAASKHLGLDPSAIEDDDLRKILSGMNSIVDGIGSLRTHTSSAHGHGRRPYRLQARHARLAVHASHTLVAFFIETWDERKRKER
jgi:Abortive infection C-terminus